jgi:hypothetical protein
VVKVVTRRLTPKNGARRRGAIAKRRLRGPDGKLVEQFWIDANSKTFDDDLTRVFTINVTRARQANTAAFGSPDGFRKPEKRLKSSGLSDGVAKK